MMAKEWNSIRIRHFHAGEGPPQQRNDDDDDFALESISLIIG